MKKIIFLFLLFPIFLGFLLCEEQEFNTLQPSPTPTPTLTPEYFQVLVFSDIHVNCYQCDMAQNFQKVVDKINNDEYPKSEFVLVSGDTVNSISSDDITKFSDTLVGYDLANCGLQPMIFKSIKEQSKIPIYVGFGNHEYNLYDKITSYDTILNREAIWKKVLGIDPYYSVKYKGFRFIALDCFRGPQWNSNFAWGSFDDAQMDWFESELQTGDPCIVYFHYPVYTDYNVPFFLISPTDRIIKTDRFYTIAKQYKDNIKAIFVGHFHTWARDTLYQTIPVYETRSTERIPELDHDQWITQNYHLIKCNVNNKTVEVTKGNPTQTYVEYAGNPFFKH